VLDGEGARLHGGRWNSPGMPVVYTAGSRALAVLELLVWTDPDTLPAELHLFEIDVPDEAVAVAELPPDWQRPRHSACRELGDAWAASARTLLLSVPSAVIPEEPNHLLNPAHPGMSSVRVVGSRPFAFDPRLLG